MGFCGLCKLPDLPIALCQGNPEFWHDSFFWRRLHCTILTFAVVEWRANVRYEFIVLVIFEKFAIAQKKERNDCESSGDSGTMTNANPRLASGRQEWIPSMEHLS